MRHPIFPHSEYAKFSECCWYSKPILKQTNDVIDDWSGIAQILEFSVVFASVHTTERQTSTPGWIYGQGPKDGMLLSAKVLPPVVIWVELGVNLATLSTHLVVLYIWVVLVWMIMIYRTLKHFALQ